MVFLTRLIVSFDYCPSSKSAGCLPQPIVELSFGTFAIKAHAGLLPQRILLNLRQSVATLRHRAGVIQNGMGNEHRYFLRIMGRIQATRWSGNQSVRVVSWRHRTGQSRFRVGTSHGSTGTITASPAQREWSWNAGSPNLFDPSPQRTNHQV